MLRDHLKAAERMMRRIDPRLYQQCPLFAQHLWRWFCELHGARQSGPVGPAPLSFSEIDSWSRLRAIPVSAEEVAVIRALDALFMEVHYG